MAAQRATGAEGAAAKPSGEEEIRRPARLLLSVTGLIFAIVIVVRVLDLTADLHRVMD